MRSTALAVLFAALLAPAPAAAETDGPTAEVLAFDAFLARSTPLCLRRAAVQCVETAWRYVDRDRSRGLSLEELQAVRGEFVSWFRWKEPEIDPGERRRILIGIVVFDLLGLTRLFELYDGDRDGAISWGELLSDVRLDDRPLGKVLSDRDAVDWQSLKRRLGALAPALGPIEPKAAE